MDSCSHLEHALLQFRVEELEARLGRLEDETRRIRRESPGQPSAGANGATVTELPLKRPTPAAVTEPVDRGGDSDREGARLVVIEMLTSGYTRDQIAAYLRQTFAVEDPETLLAEAGRVIG